MDKLISISDITIKLSGSNNGSVLSFRQKIELAKMLDSLGVTVIEANPILNGKSDFLLIKSLASTVKESILAVPVDIMDKNSVENTWEALKEAAKPRLQVSVPVSTVQMEYLCHKKPAAIIELISELVARCAALCPDVEFIAEDFSRSEHEFLQQAVGAAVEAGATMVTVCDTAGNLFPKELSDEVKFVRDSIPAETKLGVWCSNALYMADSAGFAAVRAGADEIKTSSFSNSTVSLKRFVQILAEKPDVCKAACAVNSTMLQRTIEQIKALCEAKSAHGAAAPNVTSGANDITLTIADDRATVLKAVESLGYELREEDRDSVYETFARLAAKNGTVKGKELDAIVASTAFQAPPTYKLESYVINSGNLISATCHIRLLKGEERLESVCVGDGPVDASFLAIEKLVDSKYELDDFQIQAVTEGREALGEAVVRLRYEGKVFSGRGISTDIIGSSIMAYLNAVNKIEFEEGRS